MFDSLARFLEADVHGADREGPLQQVFRESYPACAGCWRLLFVDYSIVRHGTRRGLVGTFQVILSTEEAAIVDIVEQQAWLTEIPSETEPGVFVIDGLRLAVPPPAVEAWMANVVRTSALVAELFLQRLTPSAARVEPATALEGWVPYGL